MFCQRHQESLLRVEQVVHTKQQQLCLCARCCTPSFRSYSHHYATKYVHLLAQHHAHSIHTDVWCWVGVDGLDGPFCCFGRFFFT